MHNSLAGKIVGLIISIFLIIGGLSGGLVLRGTDSSGALVVVGIGLLIYDIVLIATHNKSKNKAIAEAEINKEQNESSMKTILDETASELLSGMRDIGVYFGTTNTKSRSTYSVELNGEHCGLLSLSYSSSINLQTDRVKNVLCVISGDYKAYLFFEVTGEVEPSKLFKPGISVFEQNGVLTVTVTKKSGLTQIKP